MSSIASANGLVSGLPIQDLVDALIAFERRPITLIQNRVAQLTQRQTALLSLSAGILAVQNGVSRLGQLSLFQQAKVSSSNEGSILASAAGSAASGEYTFSVRNLANPHQVVSRGFATADASLMGAGTLSIESTRALVAPSTRLGTLNGGAGIQAGRIRITDRTGASAVVDLTGTSSVRDVIDAINRTDGVNVSARAAGDHLVLEDLSAGAGTLRVEEVGSGRTASDLGILGAGTNGVLAGTGLVYLSEQTRLESLNDGNGVRRLSGQTDFAVTLGDGSVFEIDLSDRIGTGTPLSLLNGGAGVPSGSLRITTRNGVSTNVDLSAARTIAEVKASLEGSGAGVTVTLGPQGLVVSDTTTGEHELTIEEVDGGRVADTLGILGSSATGAIRGENVYAVRTVGDVLRVINTKVDQSGAANGARLTASISADGRGIVLTDSTTGGAFSIADPNGSGALGDLGILDPGENRVTGLRKVLADLDSVLLRSLNGGSGVTTGVIELTDRSGATAQVDVSGAESLSEIIEAINAAGTGISAAVGPSGLGLLLTDRSGGTGNLRIGDASGTVAEDLGITFDGAAATVSGGNLQRQYISSATRLANLNNGRGVPAGRFRIFDSTGRAAIVDLGQGEQTLQDVITDINSRGIGVVASINETGDGLLLTDTAGGAARLRVEEDGNGSTAAALGILGEAAQGATTLDGSFETRIEVGASDTLQDVLEKIRASGADVNATIIRDGSGGNSFRLSLTSTVSGLDGAMAIDPGSTSLVFDTLSQARDAVVLFGPQDADSPLVVNSATNTLTDVISGVRLDLVGISEQPVTIKVNQDVSGAVTALGAFVATFNTAIGQIADATQFDPETETRGVLQGDSAVSRVKSRLVSIVTRIDSQATPPFDRLSSVGITLGPNSTLRFDEAKFREAYERDPQAVEKLFTDEEHGFGKFMTDSLEQLTNTEDGVISLRQESFQQTQEAMNQRITRLQTLLDKRRIRLLAQFTAMETAIARLQQQQSSLGALSALAASGA